MVGYIHSIESMGLVDGPGIRTVVFMQGCALRCTFCHNPDTWTKTNANFTFTPNELVEKIFRFKEYFSHNGGVTFSGGEPLLQIDFLIEVCSLLKKSNIHICIDTAGVGMTNDIHFYIKLQRLLEFTDLILLDVKHYDKDAYSSITGKDIKNFNDFTNVINQTNIPLWIRHVVVPTLTNGKEHIEKLKNYIDTTFNNVEKIELLPYHTLGVHKYKELNLPYALKNIEPPTAEEMQIYNDIINKK